MPALLTPGTTGVIVVHNHPSGDPQPSADDARLTQRLCAAADILDVGLLDHLIVGEDGRYYSFRERGELRLAAQQWERGRPESPGPSRRLIVGHHSVPSSLVRFAPTPAGLTGLTATSWRPNGGSYVMARACARRVRHGAPSGRKEEAMRDTNSPAVDVTIGGQTRIYHAYITTAPATLDGPATLTLYASSFAESSGGRRIRSRSIERSAARLRDSY